MKILCKSVSTTGGFLIFSHNANNALLSSSAFVIAVATLPNKFGFFSGSERWIVFDWQMYHYTDCIWRNGQKNFAE